MNSSYKKYFWGFWGGLIILILLLIIRYFNFFEQFNNYSYDFFSRNAPAVNPAHQQSLLIECAPEQKQLGAEVWLNLISLLNKAEARQVVFTFFPDSATEAFYETLAGDKTIFFGLEAVSPTDENNFTFPETNLPKSLTNPSIQTALQIIPPASKGVYRNQYAFVSSSTGQTAAHLVQRAVENRRGFPFTDSSIFGVNFIGISSESQPRLDLSQALAGNLIPSLVKNRTVFVGFKNSQVVSGLLTPMADDSQLISHTQYLAISFDTLLSGRLIHKTGLLFDFIVFALFLAAGIVFCQFLTTGLAILSVVLAFALSICFAWLIFVFGLFQIPLAELLLGQLALLFLIVTGKSLLVEEKLQAIAFVTKLRLQERLMPDTIINSPVYWHQIVGMVRQMLNLDRSIFLERVQGDFRVAEVAAANSSIGEIAERRRDYRRTPYSTALEDDGLVEVHNFLSAGISGEHQYIVPLRIAGGEVLGFWAFSVAPGQMTAIAEILPLVGTFASQISAMLFTRKLLQDEKKQQNSPLQKIITLEGGTESFNKIDDAFTLLTKRLDTVEAVFDRLGTGTILYDLFGQVVYANNKITTLCQELNVSPYKMSSSELIGFFCSQPLEEIREMLTQLIFGGGEITLHSREFAEQKATYLMTVRTVYDSTQPEKREEDQVQLQHISGILLEMHELTDIRKIMRLNEVFFRTSSTYFQNYQKSIHSILDKLKDPQLAQENRNKLVVFIEKRGEALFDSFKRVGQILNQHLLAGGPLYFPVDCVECLQAALAKLKPEAVTKKVQFVLQIPEHMVPVMAVADELEIIFQDILRYLLNDAESQSEIIISFKREYKFVDCSLRNKGYGLPDYDFQSYLLAAETELSTTFKALQDSRKHLLNYEGRFTAKSELGKGTEFLIGLKRFQ